MNKYKEELKYVKDYLENELGYKVAYIALYGSQNYNLDINNEDYKSDIDMKAIIVPTLDDLIKNSKPVSKTITINKRLNEYMIEKADLKDIREYTKQLIKSNPSYVEIFYTDYYLVDDDFKYDFEFIFDNIDELVYSNRAKMMRAVFGMAKHKEHALTKRFDGKIDIIDEYGYDSKQLMHEFRLMYFVSRYYYGLYNCEKYNFKDAIWFKDNVGEFVSLKSFLTGIKCNYFTLDQAISKSKHVIKILEGDRDNILKNIDESKIDYSVKYKIQDKINDIIKNKIINDIKED